MEKLMRILRPYWLGAGLLALALLAAGCNATGGAGQAPTQPASPAPTQLAPTAAPSATAQPVPTSTPAAATSAPAATAEPIGLLPTDSIWVRLGDTIIAQGEPARKIDIRSLNVPAVRYNAIAAPDGSAIAYVGENDRLIVADMAGGARTLPETGELIPVGFTFSPDGRALAFTLTDGQSWRLQTLDVRSGMTQTLLEGSSAPTGNGLSLTPRPLAWTPAGLVVDRVLWASDALPQGLALIDPADGSERSLRDPAHIQAIPAADGTKIALVTGELRIGETPSVAIAILDVASANETEIAPTRPGFVKALRWSPDGAMLLYALSEGYESPVTSVIAIDADGTNQQRVDFGVKGLELAVHDLDWRDATTPLVLVANQAGRIELNALPISSFEATGLRSLGAFKGDAGNQLPQILYVPRGV
jgi:dipeptidyl aminopeptidase/acylaminoacyl peptidase